VNTVTGSPVQTALWTLGPTASASPGNLALPREVALCGSFHGDLSGVAEEGAGDTRPRARRRGRIYVGPLNVAATDSTNGSANGGALPSGFFIGRLAAAFAEFTAAAIEDEGGRWVVASRADNAVYPVTAGWVDNEFDTQRRRGLDPSARTPITL
jgi:hypothetical protein